MSATDKKTGSRNRRSGVQERKLLLGELVAAVFALALQHPARILSRQRADRVKPRQFIIIQGNAGRREVIGELLSALRANNHAAYRRLMQQPGQRDLRHRNTLRIGNLAHHINAVKSPRFIHRREIKLLTAAAARRVPIAIVLTAEQPSRQRAPDHQAQAFALHHRHQLALQIPSGKGVVSL